MVAALTAAEDHGITSEQATVHLAAGVARYWQQAQRAGNPGRSAFAAAPTPEEAERLRQLEMVRRTLPGARFLNITCNADGELARQSSGRDDSLTDADVTKARVVQGHLDHALLGPPVGGGEPVGGAVGVDRRPAD